MVKFIWAIILLVLTSACAPKDVRCYATPIMQANGQVKNVVTSCE